MELEHAGETIFPIYETAVPQGGVAGEQLSPTQPIPTLPPSVSRQQPFHDEDAWGMLLVDEYSCAQKLEGLRSGGHFCPALSGRFCQLSRLWRRYKLGQTELANEAQFTAQTGTPYGMWRRPLLSIFGTPCSEPPWGQISAVDMREAGYRQVDSPLP